MNKFITFVALFCAIAYPCANAADCDAEFNMVKKTVNDLVETDDAPECVKQYDLIRFKCTAGEDEEVDRQKLEEFKAYLGGLSEEEQGAVLMCGMQLGEMALNQVGDQLSEECKEEMEKKKEEMMGNEK
ncbi:hypothetical protein TNIN_88231 [Trichonephila inaurata madagascariensis]|uniref:Uncharacterized protein n=1 Tax=Trichonephila inaurata madagascariensis TaxID=2747483 RepID=A0A8X6XIC9_9ARAC|nr:hypothetical protein TNIN_88231 [Trichonephila inaurata madagascariensis]